MNIHLSLYHLNDVTCANRMYWKFFFFFRSFGHSKYVGIAQFRATIEYNAFNERSVFVLLQGENRKTIDRYFTYSCYNDHFVTSLTSFGPNENNDFQMRWNLRCPIRRDVGFVLRQSTLQNTNRKTISLFSFLARSLWLKCTRNKMSSFQIDYRFFFWCECFNDFYKIPWNK